MLGDTSTHAYWGHPREGRGDEWATYLPMLKQAFGENFPHISSLPPYFERLEWFISIPHKDLSLIFLPNQLAYWIVPGGVALSFQGLYYNLLLVFSLAWLLRNLGVRTGLSIAGALLLLSSQFYQLWWTSNFPALGAMFLPFAILTSDLKLGWRVPLLAWSVAHVVLGQMYPPFYLAVGVALLPLLCVIRPDLLRWKYLGLFGMAALAGLGVYLSLKWDFFTAVSHTTYPGHRISLGGGATLSVLIAAILPTYPEVAAISGGGEAIYELSAASTGLGLLMMSALPTVKWDGFQVRLTIVTVLVATIMLVFMVAGFPKALAVLTGFSMIPTNRMQFGLCVLVFVFSAVTVSYQWERLRTRYIVLVLFAYACVLHFVVRQPDVILAELPGVRFFPATIVSIAIVGVCLSLTLPRYPRAAVAAVLMLGGFFALSVVTFGSFNPVMRASDILRPAETPFVQGWKQLYALNGYRPFGIGNYGHVLRGENLPALEAIHLANVDPAIYAKVFPELTHQEVEDAFNKFVGIGFSNAPRPDLSGVTIQLPIELHAPNFSDGDQPQAGAPNALSGPVQFRVDNANNGEFDIWWSGVLKAGAPASKRLKVSGPCDARSLWLTRQPSAFMGAEGARLLIAQGHLVVHAASETDAMSCAHDVALSVE